MEGPGIYFPNWYRNKKREESQPKAQNQKSWCGAQGINNGNKQTDNNGQPTITINEKHQFQFPTRPKQQAKAPGGLLGSSFWKFGRDIISLMKASSNRGLWRSCKLKSQPTASKKHLKKLEKKFSVFLWIKPLMLFTACFFPPQKAADQNWPCLIPIRSTGGGQETRGS